MTTAKVILWGTQIGTVALPDDSNIAVFRYDRNFLNSGIEVSPIVMPLDERSYSFAGLPLDAFHSAILEPAAWALWNSSLPSVRSTFCPKS